MSRSLSKPKPSSKSSSKSSSRSYSKPSSIRSLSTRTTKKKRSSDDKVTNFYKKYLSVKIPTLILTIIHNNKDIETNLEIISNIDGAILNNKVHTFFNNKEVLNPDEIYYIIFLSSLMCDKDKIMAQTIHRILKKLDYNVSADELRNNAMNFIKVISSENNEQKGGSKSRLMNIIQILKHIGGIFIFSCMVYYNYFRYIRNIKPVLTDVSQKVTTLYSMIHLYSDSNSKCANTHVPIQYMYFSKYGVRGFDKLYKLANCMIDTNVLIDNYLKVESNGVNTNRSKSKPNQNLLPVPSYIVDYENEKGLVLYNQMTNPAKDLINQLNAPIHNRDDLNNLMSQMKTYGEMKPSELKNLLFGDDIIHIDDQKINTESLTIVSLLHKSYDFISDTTKVMMSIYNEKNMNNDDIKAIDSIDNYIWTIQKYLIEEYRRLEDLKTDVVRNFEDVKLEAHHTVQNVIKLIDIIPSILTCLGIGSSMMLYYMNIIYKNLYNRHVLTIKNTSSRNRELKLLDY